MHKNRFDLDDSRLGTTDETGHRVYQFPEDVKGFWRTRRTIVFNFLIAIYLVTPWIYINGKQAIKLDFIHREFHVFGSIFYAQNAPMILFLLLAFLFIIGFVTSIWGRVWCGWACPQTVFIDSIYLRIEKFTEGSARQRIKLKDAPWSVNKFLRKSLKWFLFLLVSLHISHTFMGYFMGTHELFNISIMAPTQHLTAFLTMLFITLVILVDFGWFREQFCIIACPYGRMQSVMMDDHSKVVMYDNKRGEPRRQSGMAVDEHADCVNCFACVKACPTGIDIRRGVQMECIACTQCIDACDDIMLKTKKEKGLIRYGSAAEVEGRETKAITPRNFLYAVVLIIIAISFKYSLNQSIGLNAEILRGSRTPFTTQKEKVLNHFKIVLDQSGKVEKRMVRIEILEKDLVSQIELKTSKNPLLLKKHHKRVNIFTRFNKTLLKSGTRLIHFKITDLLTKKEIIKEVKLVGPLK